MRESGAACACGNWLELVSLRAGVDLALTVFPTLSANPGRTRYTEGAPQGECVPGWSGDGPWTSTKTQQLQLLEGVRPQGLALFLFARPNPSRLFPDRDEDVQTRWRACLTRRLMPYYPQYCGYGAEVMARASDAEGLNVTVSERTYEFLEYLIHIRGTNLGRTPTGVATSLVLIEVDKMMRRDAFALYWRQGMGPTPPKPPPEKLSKRREKKAQA